MATGSNAGRLSGRPVRRSNAEPCSQHSIAQPSTSPSASDTSAWEQRSLIAKTPSSARTTAMAVPSMTTRLAEFGGDLGEQAGQLESAHAPSSRPRSRSASSSGSMPEPLRDPLEHALAPLRAGDPREDVDEEAADDELPGDALGNAARLQVEQLLVVEATGRAGVAGTGDVAGLELQVGHGVRTRAVVEQQVAVHLVGVGAGRRPAHEHVADPDRVRARAREGALEHDVAGAVRLVVLDEDPVLEVLAALGEERTEQLGRAAGTGVRDRRDDAHDPPADRDDRPDEARVTADLRVPLPQVGPLGGTVHDGEHGELGAVADLGDDRAAHVDRRVVHEDDGGPRMAADAHVDVPVRQRRLAAQVDDDRARHRLVGGYAHGDHLPDACPGDGRRPVGGQPGGRLGVGSRDHGHMRTGRGRQRPGRRVRRHERRELVGGREPPLLLPAVGNGEVIDVRRRDARGMVDGRGCKNGHPTAPSIWSSMRRFSSRAYSIGSSRAMGSMKPRTIIAIASSSVRPRDMR